MASTEFLTPAQVVPLFPERPPHPNTVLNWMQVGCRGVFLDFRMVGDRYLTTKAWVEKFKAARKAKALGRKQAALQQNGDAKKRLRAKHGIGIG